MGSSLPKAWSKPFHREALSGTPTSASHVKRSVAAMHQPPDSSRWVLNSPGPPHTVPSQPLARWIQELAAGPKATIGELEDCPIVPDVASAWAFAVMPEYILPHSCVAAMASASGEYAMLFFQKVGLDVHQQERPSSARLLGWFHVRLVEPIQNRQSLVTNLCHALELLRSRGVLAT